MLFNPNRTCVIIKNVGYNIYGEPERTQRITEKCALLEDGRSIKQSSVRADSSASRGNALETVADYWFILMPDTKAELDDLIEIDGVQVKIVEISPRFSLYGVKDHVEAKCEMWNEDV